MSAREVVREIIGFTKDGDGHTLGLWVADDVIKNLDAAGFRIVRESEPPHSGERTGGGRDSLSETSRKGEG